MRAGALVLAHGLRYDPPPLPGIQSLWGRSVFHCPFCDGWEVRDRPLAVHGNGPEAARSALVISGWSSDVVLCTDGPARLNGERAALAAAGVRVREEPIRELAGRAGRLDRIEFTDGPAERREALFVRTHRGQPNGLAEALGCPMTGAGTIVTDGEGRTDVPGVYAAGDAATERLRSVANAIGTGSRVAYSVAPDLVPWMVETEYACGCRAAERGSRFARGIGPTSSRDASPARPRRRACRCRRRRCRRPSASRSRRRGCRLPPRAAARDGTSR